MWYVRSGEKNLGPYPEAQLRQFIAAGKLPPETYILRQGTEQWLRVKDSPLGQPLAIAEDASPANPFDFLNNSSKPAAAKVEVKEPAKEQLQNPYWTDFAGSPQAVPVVSPANVDRYQFRSPTGMRNGLLILTGVLAIMHIVMIVSNFSQQSLLNKFKNGFYAANPQQAEIDGQANDERHNSLTILQLVLSGVFVLTYFFWKYRVNANTWAMGARGMKITPGWAVGWYFVPFMNLARPYQAMQEIWKASTSPSDWQRQPASSLVGFWWFFYLTSAFFTNFVSRYTDSALKSNDLNQLLSAVNFMIYAEFYDFVPLTLITLVILRISNMQIAHVYASESQNAYRSF